MMFNFFFFFFYKFSLFLSFLGNLSYLLCAANQTLVQECFAITPEAFDTPQGELRRSGLIMLSDGLWVAAGGGQR